MSVAEDDDLEQRVSQLEQRVDELEEFVASIEERAPSFTRERDEAAGIETSVTDRADQGVDVQEANGEEFKRGGEAPA